MTFREIIISNIKELRETNNSINESVEASLEEFVLSLTILQLQ